MTGLISASSITKESNFISSLLFRYQRDGGTKEQKPGKMWRKKVFKIGKKKGGLNTPIAASRKVQEGGQHKWGLHKQTALCMGRGWSPGVGCAELWGSSRGIFGQGAGHGHYLWSSAQFNSPEKSGLRHSPWGQGAGPRTTKLHDAAGKTSQLPAIRRLGTPSDVHTLASRL